jgi:hypothetical protein
MAVGIRMKFAGLEAEQFDAVNEHVDPAAIRRRACCFTPQGRSTAVGA